MTVKLTWTPGTGATSQTVQYRLQGSGSWTTYTTYNNNTTSSAQVTLPNGDYQFRILNSCTECVCLEGQTSNNDGGCITTQSIPATQSGTPISVTRTPFVVYGNEGTRVYQSASISAPFNLLNTGNQFWIRQNIPNFFTNYDAQQRQQLDLNNGPVNRLAIWGIIMQDGAPLNNYNIGSASLPPTNDWIGFTVCINIPTEKTYHIAIAADNYYRFSLNGQLLLADTRNDSVVFNYLHIYPVTIPAGTHLLLLEGLNVQGNACFGCEVYDLSNRGSQSVVDFLNAQTNYDNINVIFSTRNVTSFTSNLYTCPEGYNQINPTCNQVMCTGEATVPCTDQPASSNIVSINSQPCPPPNITTTSLTEQQCVEYSLVPTHPCTAGDFVTVEYIPCGQSSPVQATRNAGAGEVYVCSNSTPVRVAGCGFAIPTGNPCP